MPKIITLNNLANDMPTGLMRMYSTHAEAEAAAVKSGQDYIYFHSPSHAWYVAEKGGK